MRILYLTLKRKLFLEIAYGKKRYEYRQAKPYWIARLLDREFDEIHFRNGFRADAPFLRVVYDSTHLIERVKEGEYFFVIMLGAVLEVKNINLLAYPNPWLTEILVGMKKTGLVSKFIASN